MGRVSAQRLLYAQSGRYLDTRKGPEGRRLNSGTINVAEFTGVPQAAEIVMRAVNYGKGRSGRWGLSLTDTAIAFLNLAFSTLLTLLCSHNLLATPHS